jgi:hypothetical protein
MRNVMQTCLVLLIFLFNVIGVIPHASAQSKETPPEAEFFSNGGDKGSPDVVANPPTNERQVEKVRWDLFTSATATPNPSAPDDTAWNQWRQVLAIMTQNTMPSYAINDTLLPALCNQGGTTSVDTYSKHVFGFAVAYKLGAYPYTGYTMYTQAQLLTVTKKLIASIVDDHVVNDPSNTYAWGTSYSTTATCIGWPEARNWSPSFATSRVAFAAWLMWDELAADPYYVPFQKKVRDMVEYEADRFIQSPYFNSHQGSPNNVWPNVGYLKDRQGDPLLTDTGDTKAEEDAWMARVLFVATAMLPNHPHWDSWMTKGLELAIAANGRPNDTVATTLFHGKPLSYWLNGTNIENNGTMTNHYNRIQPDYFAEIGNVMLAALTSSLSGRATPKGAFYNSQLVYGALTTPIATVTPYALCPYTNSSSGYVYVSGSNYVCYPQGTTGSGPPRIDVYALMDGMAQTYFTGANASTWEGLHLQGAIAAANGTAPWYPDTEPSPTPTAHPTVAPPALDKTGEAYLMKWLQKQQYFAAAVPLTDTASNIPVGWRDQDLGPVGKMGYATYSSSGVYTVKGGGNAPASNEERTHFTYQEWQSDGALVAHLPSIWSATPVGAQVGIMIRESLAANSPSARLILKADSGGAYHAEFKWRSEANGVLTTTVSANSYNWLKLVRVRDQISAYGCNSSTSCSTWTSLGTVDAPLKMSSRVFVGLTASSYDVNSYTTASFDQVSVSATDTHLQNSASDLSVSVVTASSTNGSFVPNNTRGGGLTGSSRWSSSGYDNQWIEYDLGAVKRVDSVGISWYGGDTNGTPPTNERIQAFEIQASLDDSYYTTVYSGTSSGANLAYPNYNLENYRFMPVVARYIRIVGHGNSTPGYGPPNTSTEAEGWRTEIVETKIYGGNLTEVFTTRIYSTSLLCDISGANPNLTNGLLEVETLNWQCGTLGPTNHALQIDSASAVISHVGIGWLRGNSLDPTLSYPFLEWRSTKFDIQIYNGSAWQTVRSGVWSTGRTKAIELYALPPNITAQKIRLVNYGNTHNDLLNMMEWRIYGQAAGCGSNC